MGIPVHVTRLDSGFRITAELPCASTMQVALNALLAINPAAYAYPRPGDNDVGAVMDDEVPLRGFIADEP